jgi:DNA-binding NarL/FixJ family response regulator
MAVRVFHCDDSDAFRLLVAELLADEPDIELVGDAASARAAVATAPQCDPDVVLLDLSGGDLGPEAIAAMRAVVPDAAIVVLSGWDGPIDGHPVAARLDKGVSADALAQAILRAGAGAARRMTDGAACAEP